MPAALVHSECGRCAHGQQGQGSLQLSADSIDRAESGALWKEPGTAHCSVLARTWARLRHTMQSAHHTPHSNKRLTLPSSYTSMRRTVHPDLHPDLHLGPQAG